AEYLAAENQRVFPAGHRDALFGHAWVLGEHGLDLALGVLIESGHPTASFIARGRSLGSGTTSSRSSRIRKTCAYGECVVSRRTRSQSICSRSDRASGSALAKSQ